MDFCEPSRRSESDISRLVGYWRHKDEPSYGRTTFLKMLRAIREESYDKLGELVGSYSDLPQSEDIERDAQLLLIHSAIIKTFHTALRR